MISAMIGISERTTMDIDTTIRGIQMEENDIVQIVKEILTVNVGDDILFEYKSVEPIREEIFKNAVLHTAQKRESIEDIHDWKDILKDLREEPQMLLLWDNYISENKYIGNLEFHAVLNTLEEIAMLLNF